MSRWHKWRAPRGEDPRVSAVSRRAFLGGAGALITLPFLPSLLPRGLARAGDTPPVRVIYYYVPNGIYPGSYHPTAVGRNFELSPALSALNPYKSQMLIFSGLDNLAAEDPNATSGDHVRGYASALTGQLIRQTLGDDIQNGQSIDQVIAQHHLGATPYDSLEFSMVDRSTGDSCDSGYACAYRNISWAGPQTPRGRMVGPRLAFDRLFGGSGTVVGPELDLLRARRRSVLDMVLGDLHSLEPRLSPSDQGKLDEYLTGLRELERRLDAPVSSCAAPAQPADWYPYDEGVPIMNELMVRAIECDLSRVASLMFEVGGDEEHTAFLGMDIGSHEISHHGGDPERIALYDRVTTWRTEMLRHLLDLMSAVPEGDGTLLDHSVVVMFSDVGDGDAHTHRSVPTIAIGRGGGVLDTGRHLDMGGLPLADFHTSIAQIAGVPIDRFGRDGTGPLPGLLL